MMATTSVLLLAGVFGSVAIMAVAATSASALAPLPVRQPGDAAAQIEAGWAVYDAICARCHGAEGEGGEGPRLVGPGELRSFRTVQRLHSFVRLSMPNDAPGSLSDQEYYDVVAFLLDWNGLNPDGVVIDADTASEISLTE